MHSVAIKWRIFCTDCREQSLDPNLQIIVDQCWKNNKNIRILEVCVLKSNTPCPTPPPPLSLFLNSPPTPLPVMLSHLSVPMHFPVLQSQILQVLSWKSWMCTLWEHILYYNIYNCTPLWLVAIFQLWIFIFCSHCRSTSSYIIKLKAQLFISFCKYWADFHLSEALRCKWNEIPCPQSAYIDELTIDPVKMKEPSKLNTALEISPLWPIRVCTRLKAQNENIRWSSVIRFLM